MLPGLGTASGTLCNLLGTSERCRVSVLQTEREFDTREPRALLWAEGSQSVGLKTRLRNLILTEPLPNRAGVNSGSYFAEVP